MTSCRSLAVLAMLVASFLLGGCASNNVSLVEVREFADASAKLGGYTELSKRYRDTYLREQPYLSPAADRLARENDAKRRAIYDDCMAVQKALVLYMQTLSMLASDARYDLTPQLDDLGSGVKALSGSGLELRHVAAYTGLTRLLTRAIASGYQNRSVETMVRDGDEHVRVLLDGMMTLTRLYNKTHDNEKKIVLGIFDVEIPFSGKPQDRMLVTIAKVHYMDKAQEYKLLDRRYDLALQGLTKVALGHQKLREHLDQMGGTEMRHLLADYARDLNVIRLALNN
ncbi:MAG: hypothetical protein V4484_22540 [Pseudomonadota bacterium]